MSKIAILKFEADGSVSATLTNFNNDAEATASIKETGSYSFAEVNEIEVEGSTKKPAATTKASRKRK